MTSSLEVNICGTGVRSIDEATLVNRLVTALPKRFVSFMSNWSMTDRT